ncbi:MAG: diacylglycerol kinase [Candidatus Omnitrophica bacterium]|nr:diacylglycerol kinase [Candidatus Omnitrophota bacterium]
MPVKFVESFNCAVEGFIYVLKTQRNMRIHFMFGTLIFILGLVTDFSRIELICLATTITMVLFAEMINTTIEHTIDLISDTFHPLARVIKDVSAGAVLVVAIGAVISGYLLFMRHLRFSLINGFNRMKDSPVHITVIALIIVCAFVIFVKVLLHKGTPLKGGLPSGHTAFSFAMWTIILFSTSNPLIIILSLAMAVLVARSRWTQKVHNLWEIIAGAALGILATAFIFQLFR